MIGKSSVLPLVVIVLTPLVAANVVIDAEALIVIPLDTVRFPYIVTGMPVIDPENPVKLREFTAPLIVNA